MDAKTAERFVGDRHIATLITLRRDGRAQSSNIAYAFADGTMRISVTSDRAKTHNLRRDPRAVAHVSSDDFWQYVACDGTAELSEPTTSPGDEVGQELAGVFEAVQGKPHPDWDEFYKAMVDEERLVIRLTPTSYYGMVR